MSSLITQQNLERADDFYQQLIDLHADRPEADSLRVNARLILLLANHIGDASVLSEAIAIAGVPRRQASS